MPEISDKAYIFDRGHPFIDEITADRAQQLFDEASRRPGSELKGTLDDGFEYTVARSSSISCLRVRVYPAVDGEPQ